MKKNLKRLLLIGCIMSFTNSAMAADGHVLSKDVYKLEMNHKDIQVIQEALKKDGSLNLSKTTTYFGPITEKAVEKFQKKYELKSDGIVGKATVEKMTALNLFDGNIKPTNYTFSKNVYKLGMNHSDMKVLQDVLKKDGVFKNNHTTTYFGPITEKAVKTFQNKYGLKADGIIGKSTINKMKSLGFINGSIKASTTSRGTSQRNVGEYLDWSTQVSNKIINRGDILLIKDLKTGKTFKVKMAVGTNHADCEALNKQETAIMKEIWGGFSWERRPVLVYKDGRSIAASMTNMPHAGLDNKPNGQTVSNRSGGFGSGYNFDLIKGNGMDGHVDLHFKNSKRHKDNKKDPKHQQAVKKAAGIK
ncbi:peptidoglycan-binding domain-containing protein [Marinisporobacter balticus]|uniref:Peptidoglycan hydrolase-like protein with peptidoglycan-binding domain n=1 Tax=Marinisporobacter balticus TaxID=2018667 RepID=A0A4R2L5Y9_9FIRM|nr:peptidoglycan-binding protein [Marinisporobacter balticus]TCO74595.1 peptidoglycan hydrolase-like protein with peptidoglycan-binding domain [Marinisporobacter balticus]